MTTTSKYKRVNVHGIRWAVGKFHVSVPRWQVGLQIAKRIHEMNTSATHAEIRYAARVAMAMHEKNRSTYVYVMACRVVRPELFLRPRRGQ